MNQAVGIGLYVCSHCGEKLALQEFNVSRKDNLREHYCKKCSREYARRYRSSKKLERVSPEQLSPRTGYPVITEIKDPDVRMALLLQAKARVRQMCLDKRRRQRETGDDEPSDCPEKSSR
ncbi:MAG: hypothetical protein IJ511_04930 [Bacteroides sp.]|nr:hypothetical protein [Bacteroides sp.]